MSQIAIIGHSYVHWLAHFIHDSTNGFPAVQPDFGLSQARKNLPIFRGIRGATLKQFLPDCSVIQDVINASPAIVVIHLGGNDLDCLTASPEAVGMGL